MNPYTLQKEGQRNLVIDKHNNTFAVSNVLYEILYDHLQGLHADNISKALVSKYKNEGFAANFVEDALKLALDRFASANYAYDGLDGFLVGKITLVPEGSLTIIYRTLSRLFNRYILVVLLPLAILLTANVFYTYELYSAAQIFEVSVSISDSLTLVLSYLFFLVFIFFHELGHASATTYFGLSPKKIGFGFYFIFPVFYTDVTPIWRLNVRKRNVVNIGGIYFQLLINIILVILLEYDIAFPLVFNLFIANTINIVVSLNPFFRYDGYWIFSDTLQLSNLTKKARDLTLSIALGRSFPRFRNTEEWATAIYTILRACFWLFIYYELYNYIMFASQKVLDGGRKVLWGDYGDDPFIFIMSSVTLISTVIFVVLHLSGLYKYLKSSFRSLK